MTSRDRQIQSLQRRLRQEEDAHSETRRLLQTEIARIWRLVPSHYINLMGAYPPLRRLLHVLGEASDLADPSRGAPIEDTMRSQFVHVGVNASTSHTEAGVAAYDRARRHTTVIRDEIDGLAKYFNKLLDDKARSLARLVGAEEWEYQPPDGVCAECGKDLYQTATGRRREFCSDTCRQRSSRNDRSQRSIGGA